MQRTSNKQCQVTKTGMKKLAILLLVCVAFSCKKEKENNIDKIAGMWELRKTDGGIAGVVYFQKGNGDLINFKRNGTYEKISGGSVWESGTYLFGPSPVAGEWLLTLNTPTNTVTESVRLKFRELIFKRVADCCDFIETTYERVQ